MLILELGETELRPSHQTEPIFISNSITQLLSDKTKRFPPSWLREPYHKKNSVFNFIPKQENDTIQKRRHIFFFKTHRTQEKPHTRIDFLRPSKFSSNFFNNTKQLVTYITFSPFFCGVRKKKKTFVAGKKENVKVN